jgi:starch synthase
MPLPLGLWAADAIVAVSPAYAAEMQTREFGGGLHRFLHKHARRLRGILNGIDTTSYDPARDAALFAKYSSQDLRRRSPNKQALQARLGLAQRSNVPILGVVSRLDVQKGMDLLIRALRSPRLARRRWQAVVLGHGDQRLEKAARELQRRYRRRVRVETRYDAVLARQIYAGADILVMPSRYEPCGLAQMIAMRYGCVPLVRAVGGLRETVQDQKNGFTFGEPTTAALRRTLISAMAQYGDEARWRGLQLAGMGMDFSWAASARQYLDLYRTLTR